MFENIVNDFIFFYCKYIISPQHHGFLPKISYTTKKEFIVLVAQNSLKSNQTDVFCADLSKDFDVLTIPLWLQG